MGWLPLYHLLKACTCSTVASSKIKVMTVEGRCLRFTAPILVKEVLMDYPSHALFLSDCVRSQGDRARPLHNTISLQPGFLYFLLPQAKIRRSRSDSTAPMETSAPAFFPNCTRTRKVSFAPTTSADSRHSPILLQTSVDSAGVMASSIKVTAASSAGAMESLKEGAVEFLPSPSEGVLRVKIVVSKRQLAGVLRDRVAMVEGLLSPLLQEAEAASKSNISRVSCSLSWTPSLQSIPESSSKFATSSNS